MAADFSSLGICWRGWRVDNTRHESFFGPVTFSGFDEEGKRLAPEAWEQVDLHLESLSRRANAPSKKLARFVTSCVVRLCVRGRGRSKGREVLIPL